MQESSIRSSNMQKPCLFTNCNTQPSPAKKLQHVEESDVASLKSLQKLVSRFLSSSSLCLRSDLLSSLSSSWEAHRMPQQPSAAASLSLAVGGVPGFTVNNPPHGLRTAFFAGVAVVSGFLVWVKRGHADGVRRRVIRRLDRVAPRTKYNATKEAKGEIINGDCPVCLCEFAKMIDKPIRVLECRHALCSECLEAWAVHCTKAHLNPSRFGITRAGRVVSWTPGPKCPLCCARVNCVPREDLREAVIAAINQRGSALSTIIAYHARSSSSTGDFQVEEGDSWRNAASAHNSS